jgi:hypothetical protein
MLYNYLSLKSLVIQQWFKEAHGTLLILQTALSQEQLGTLLLSGDTT